MGTVGIDEMPYICVFIYIYIRIISGVMKCVYLYIYVIVKRVGFPLNALPHLIAKG